LEFSFSARNDHAAAADKDRLLACQDNIGRAADGLDVRACAPRGESAQGFISPNAAPGLPVVISRDARRTIFGNFAPSSSTQFHVVNGRYNASWSSSVKV
jgi:hypothetical protein